MSLTMYWYPKCSTCNDAKKYLDDQKIVYKEKNIVETPPDKETIKTLIKTNGLDIKKFFNTSGIKYRELKLSEKLKYMDEDEKLSVLLSDGMLIKRPLVTDNKKVTLGFKSDVFLDTWK